MYSGAVEEQAIPAPFVAPVVLHCLKIISHEVRMGMWLPQFKWNISAVTQVLVGTKHFKVMTSTYGFQILSTAGILEVSFGLSLNKCGSHDITEYLLQDWKG